MKKSPLLSFSTTITTILTVIWPTFQLGSVSAALYETMQREQEAERAAKKYKLRRELDELRTFGDVEEFDELIVPSNTIRGGDEATAGYFPWFVELFAFPDNGDAANARRCGGAMISGDLVVTAANCLYDLNGNFADRLQSFAIIKRENNVRVGEGIYRTWKVIRPNPDHRYPSLINNVAIIKISGVKLFPEYDIGAINSDTSIPSAGTTVTGMGYGASPLLSAGKNIVTEKLMFANFTVVRRGTNCNIPDNTGYFCLNTTDFALDEEDVAFCAGDEGAPIVFGDNKLGYQAFYGIYMGQPGLCGAGIENAIVLRVAAYSNFILQVACEIAEARCLAACPLLATATGFAAESIQSLARFVGTMYNTVTGRGGTVDEAEAEAEEEVPEEETDDLP